MASPALAVKDLCVDFDRRKGRMRVLRNVSLAVESGVSLGIVGESGCGKSMTALAAMRLIPSPPGRITSGEIRLRERDLLQATERQMQDIRGNEIAMIFQEPMTSLNPVFTVGSQIMESIRRHQKVSRQDARKRAADSLEAVGIPEPLQRLSQYPHELSGGMRQRAMIAMALSCEPSVLIADEPTTALDVTVQAQIFDLLLEIQEKTGTAILLITHDMGVIAEVTRRVMVMYAGRKVEEGPVEEIISNPGHPYTQGLIQCVPHLSADPGPVRKSLLEIPGMVPDLGRLDEMCAFRHRCGRAFRDCWEGPPPVSAVGLDHHVACWMAGAGL
jgi:oligopeptide/dipeptide ABC transporter ATP-binding protein